MAEQVTLNNAVGTVDVQLEIVDTTVTIDATLAGLLSAGVNFPYEYILLTLNAENNPAAWEIVKATAIAGLVVTIERAQEGTTAAQWVINAEISSRVTTGTIWRAREQVQRQLTDSLGRLLLDGSGNILLGDEV